MANAANDLVRLTGGSVELPDEISQSFMQYALSIILGRALPDARDGLKPVHRRILYAMSGLGLGPNSSHRKCARVVGEVLGKYHPHGDVAVYDALVRLAQDFSTGTPLIDGHGNFGSIDNDPAAAMRYTECKLTKVSSEALLDDLNSATVDFVPNFDGNEVEPTVLPAKLPILLLNGCAGIAVGMATNCPPHNLNELMDACIALTEAKEDDAPEVTDQRLFKLVPGPDFPTGALIIGTDGSKKLYKTGNGGVVMRAVTHVEQIVTGRGKTRSAIVVTELPYQVNKAALLEKIADLVNDKKIEGVADLRDESDRDGIRVVIELKRDAVAAVVQNNLLKKSALQTTFSGNFLALMGSGTVPQRFTLRAALDTFLDFRFLTIRRKAAYQLTKVKARAHTVEGLLKALQSADEVIELVRSAPDQNEAREALMDPSNERLGLSRDQADAVLKLQLGQLTRLNKGKLLDEQETLSASKAELENLLNVDTAVRSLMIKEFNENKRKFGVPRRTQIQPEEGELEDIDLVKNSRSVIVVTRGGYIKRMPLKTFESQGRGTRGKKGTSSTSEDNEVSHCFTCNDHDTLLMTTQKGIAFGLRAFQVPTGTRTAKGVPIPSVLPVKTDDIITSVLTVSEFTEEEYVVLATENGWIKKTSLKAFENLSSRGLIIATLEDGDRLAWCQKCTDKDDILIGSRLGMATRFSAEKLRPTGRTSRGVRSMKLKEGDTVADMNVLPSDSVGYVLAVTSSGYGKRINTSDFRTTARGGVGVIAIKFKQSNAKDVVSCLLIVNEDDEVLVITAKGIMVRQKVKDISTQSRTATGVLVQRVDVENGDHITSVSLVPTYEETD
mmetsp:Transcript_25222/g.55070  ORF Transcript_25222/g.55070 Transcript_25222/m.55070 type:complete len:840 (+) Transcript_25222:638-3157(+)